MTYSNDLRSRALKLYYVDKYKIKQISKLLGIDRKTLYNWKKQYPKQNIINLHMNKIKENIILENNKIKINANKDKIKKYKIKREYEKYILKMVINNPYFNCKQLCCSLKKKYKLFVSESTLYKWLSKNEITYKKVRHKIVANVKDLLKCKKELALKIKRVTDISQSIISIDEASYVTNMMPHYGWSKKGEKSNFIVNNKRRIRYTVICAIDKNKIIDYTIIKGSSNATTFTEFVKSIISNDKSCTLLLDNAQIHRSKEFTKYIATTKINLLYNIPYNPESNPIEHVFNKAKQITRKQNTTTEELLNDAIIKGFKSISRTNLRNFYKKSFDTLLNKKIHDETK